MLNERELSVLWRTMDLGWESGTPANTNANQQELGDELAISRQRVSQLHYQALEKLRKACAEDPALAQSMAELCELPQ